MQADFVLVGLDLLAQGPHLAGHGAFDQVLQAPLVSVSGRQVLGMDAVFGAVAVGGAGADGEVGADFRLEREGSVGIAQGFAEFGPVGSEQLNRGAADPLATGIVDVADDGVALGGGEHHDSMRRRRPRGGQEYQQKRRENPRHGGFLPSAAAAGPA